jgi:hypothetical protein
MYDAGTAAVQIIPSFRNFQRKIAAQMTAAGAAGGKAYLAAFTEATKGMPAPSPGGPGGPTKTGAEQGSAFARAFKAAVTGALRDLPEVTIDANSTQAQKDIAEIRTQLATLRDSKIGVDIDATAALNHLEFLRGELVRLGAESADPSVQLDTALATAQLARIQAQIASLDAQDVDIDVDVDAGAAMAQLLGLRAMLGMTGGGFSALIAVGIALAPALIPVIAAVTAGVAALAGVAVVAVGGLAAVALALLPVVGAVMAMGKANDEASKSAGKSARSQLQVAGALDAVESAERSLDNTRQNAAEAAVRAAQAVRDAQRSLTNEQRAARAAQLALTAAQEEARRALQDLDTQVKEGALAQQRANLQVEESKRDLDRVLMDPTSNEYQREQARLTYQEAVQQVDSLKIQQERLVADKAVADKKGIAGSKQVVAAQDNIRTANERVAKAQRDVAEARASQDAQARQSAFSIIQAQQGVISAQRSLQQAAQASGAVGGSAMEDLRKKMAGLTPEGQRFAKFLYSLKGTFTGLSKAAQRGLFPGLESGIRAVTGNKKAMSGFERLVFSLAKAMGSLADKTGKALASPHWQKFFDYLGSIAGPTMDNISSILGNLATAFSNLLMAFTPTSKQMGDGLVGMTKSFADWSSGLKTNKGFQDFIAYIKTNGPKVMKFLGGLLHTLEKVGEFLAPLGSALMDGLSGFFDWLASLSPKTFMVLLGGLGAIAAALVLIAGGPVTLFVAGVTFVIAALVLAYNRFTWFRTIVDAVFKAISVAAQWLWQNVLVPVFRALVWWIQNVVGPGFKFLWEKVIKPAFAAISAVISWVWENVIKPVFAALSWTVTKVIGPAFSWLYENVIKPVWGGIKVAIAIAWTLIKVVFGLIQIGVRVMGAVFSWLYDHAVKPAWDKISAAISWVWNKVLKPTFSALGGFIEKYVAPAFSKGVEAIKKAWEKVQEVAKKPIGFVIKTILEGGILKAYNALAKHFPGVSEVHVPKDILAKFATGGEVTGGVAGYDSVPALLMPNEHVWTSREVDAVGGHGAMQRLRRAAVSGMLPRFAKGGGVGDWISTQYHRATNAVGSLVSGAKDLLTDPMGALRRILDKAIAAMPGKDSGFGKLAVQLPAKIFGGLADKLKGLVGFGGAPDPSLYKGSSPSTTAIIGLGRASGVPFHVTSTFRPGSRSLSGNLDNHSRGLAVDMASSVPNMQKLAAWFLRFTPYLKELIHSGGEGFFVKNGRRVGRSFYGSEVAGHYDHVHVAATNAAIARAQQVYKFDDGGMLPPGLHTVYNGLRKPEPLGNLDKLAASAGKAAFGGLTIRAVVEDGAVRGLVRLEVDDAFGSLADAKVYGQ